MPPKQKPRLSCKSTASARSQHTHSEQSDEEQQGLLAAQHQHDASRRQHEALKQRQSRQAANEAGTASAGLEVEESREHREERLSSDRQQDASVKGHHQSISSLVGKVPPSAEMDAFVTKGATGGNVDLASDHTSNNSNTDQGMEDNGTRDSASETSSVGDPGKGVCARMPVKLEPGLNCAPLNLKQVKIEVAVGEELLYPGGDITRDMVDTSDVAQEMLTPKVEIDVAEETPGSGGDGNQGIGKDCTRNCASETAGAIGGTGQEDFTETMMQVEPSCDDPSSSRSACALPNIDSKPKRQGKRRPKSIDARRKANKKRRQLQSACLAEKIPKFSPEEQRLRERLKKQRQRERQTEEDRQRERKYRRTLMARRREVEGFRDKERERNRLWIAKRRQNDPAYRKRETERKAKLRQDEGYQQKQRELKQLKQLRLLIRQDEEKRQREAEQKRKLRQEQKPKLRQDKESDTDREQKRKLRQEKDRERDLRQLELFKQKAAGESKLAMSYRYL